MRFLQSLLTFTILIFVVLHIIVTSQMNTFVSKKTVSFAIFVHTVLKVDIYFKKCDVIIKILSNVIIFRLCS